MSHWHELDGNMRAADDYYGVCHTRWDGQAVPDDDPEWECPDCGAMWYLDAVPAWECPDCVAMRYLEEDEE